MKEKRYFYSGKIFLDNPIELDSEESHHLINVMRTNIGDNVCLFNGDGNNYFGKVTEISKKAVKVLVNQLKPSNCEPNINLDVYQALAKGDKLSLIMQKITELGASKFILFESKYCDVKANTNKRERMDKVSISAAKQCGRSSIVLSCGILNISEICEKIKSYDKFFVAYEMADGKSLFECLKTSNKLNNIALMIGAEGGFSADEIEKLKDAGAEIVTLGRRILRTETASIAGTALIMQMLDNGENK